MIRKMKRNADGKSLTSWSDLKELRLGARDTLRSKPDDTKTTTLGADWQGTEPEFRNLRWLTIETKS